MFHHFYCFMPFWPCSFWPFLTILIILDHLDHFRLFSTFGDHFAIFFSFWGIGGYCIFFRLEITAVWTISVGKNKSLIVYLCISVFLFFVFALLTHRNTIFDILAQSSFHKYISCWVFLAIHHLLYLCMCVFVSFCICDSDAWEYHFWYPSTFLFS